ncbi:MAG: beta-galactosidase [Candidatus Marinimicrobia bacterium]|nr:beta-galactosidase [Candidatus Neomarinimicrobiota bacterium]
MTFYPYGTQYHRAPTPLPEEWDGDLCEIARKGYTHVQFRPQWRWHERLRGSATWDDLDRLFDLAAKHGLRVILKPMLETAPDWVFQELGGTRIGFHGVPISPFAHGAYYVGGWWPCFDNPAVVEAAASFVRELVARYHQHPALWFYNAWNEPVSRPLGACHCAHSQQSYRDWLKRRYGTIEELNAAFGKAWTSFDTVRAPEAAADYVEMFLWRKWAGFAVAEQVRFVAEAIRAIDSDAHVMVHTGGSLVAQDAAWAVSDDFQNAAHVDRYGTSFWVPLHPKTPIDHAAPEFQSSWLRRVDPDYWCQEFYPNHGNWCRPPEPQTLKSLVWSAIFGGAGGFTFWQYRSERLGNEANGHGLRNIDGSATPRSQVADRIAAILREYGPRLLNTRRIPSPVALLYSHDSDLISRIQAMPDKVADLSHEPDRVNYPYKRAIRAAHTLHMQAGIAPDWVVPGDNLDAVELLHVTAAEMSAAKTADWLREFVRRGGNLIVEFPFACRDHRTWVSPRRPDYGLDDLLGAVERDRVEATAEDIAEFANGVRIPASDWRIELTATTGEVLAKWPNGSAAALRNRYGNGSVWVLGLSLSLAFLDQPRDPSATQFANLLDTMSLPDLARRCPDAQILRRCGPNHEVWFVRNIGGDTARLSLPAAPTAVWDADGAECTDTELVLSPGAFWVGELRSPVAPDPHGRGQGAPRRPTRDFGVTRGAIRKGKAG